MERACRGERRDKIADTSSYREQTRQGSDIWDEVTDNATRREFIERFRDHWPQS